MSFRSMSIRIRRQTNFMYFEDIPTVFFFTIRRNTTFQYDRHRTSVSLNFTDKENWDGNLPAFLLFRLTLGSALRVFGIQPWVLLMAGDLTNLDLSVTFNN